MHTLIGQTWIQGACPRTGMVAPFCFHDYASEAGMKMLNLRHQRDLVRVHSVGDERALSCLDSDAQLEYYHRTCYEGGDCQ